MTVKNVRFYLYRPPSSGKYTILLPKSSPGKPKRLISSTSSIKHPTQKNRYPAHGQLCLTTRNRIPNSVERRREYWGNPLIARWTKMWPMTTCRLKCK